MQTIPHQMYMGKEWKTKLKIDKSATNEMQQGINKSNQEI
jgi:hypothetical protein